ncbi:hypothetical protein [Streptomyces globisporus]|uniref:hypothetical protein n=2 Tax=Streptomyces globisporus TaxID=1908 RepID=UPI0034615B96|nr:hypothetical protein OG838_00025 [Streptomyces globisporus]
MEEIDFPPDVRTMLWILLGEMPLQARENLAWESRELYLALQRGLIDLRVASRETIQMVEAALPPEVARPYIESVRMLTDEPGGTDPVQQLLFQLDELANGQVDYSQKIQASKWEIIAEIIMLIAELAILAALIAFTGGASVSQMFLARARSKLAILIIIDRLLRMSRVGSLLGEAVQEAIVTLATRLAQIALNTGGRKPGGVDWKDVGVAAAFGALTAGFMEIFDKFLKPIKNIFKDLLGDVFGKFKIDPNSLLFKGLVNGPPTVVTVFVVGGAAESTAEVIINGAFYDKWEFKWETFVGSGTSTVFDMGAGLAIGAGAFSIYNNYFNNDRFTDVNELPGPDSRLGGGPGSGKPDVGPDVKGPSTVKSSLFTPGPAVPFPNPVSTELPSGIGSGLSIPPPTYTPPPPYTSPSALNILPTGGRDVLSGPFDLTTRDSNSPNGTNNLGGYGFNSGNGFNGSNSFSDPSGPPAPYVPPSTSSAFTPSTLPSGRTSGPSAVSNADLTTPDLTPQDLIDGLTPDTPSNVPRSTSDLPQGLTTPKGSSTAPDSNTPGGMDATHVDTDPGDAPFGQDGTRDVPHDTTGQDLPGQGQPARNTGAQPGTEHGTHQQVNGAPPATDAESDTVTAPTPLGTSAGPNTTAPASAPGAHNASPGTPESQSQQSSRTDLTDGTDATGLTDDDVTGLPDQQADRNGQEYLSDGTDQSLTPAPRDTNTTVPEGDPAPPTGLRSSSEAPQPDAASLSGEAPAEHTGTDAETGADALTGPTPEPSLPIADPVRPEQRRAGTHDAPAVPTTAPEAPAVSPDTSSAEASDGRSATSSSFPGMSSPSSSPPLSPSPPTALATSSSSLPAPGAGPQQGDLPGLSGPDADLAPDGAEAVGASGPVSGTTADAAPGSPAWEAARAGVEPVPRSHTWVDPVSTPPDPQQQGRTTQFVVRSKFEVRRFGVGGDHVTDLTVEVGVGSPDRMPDGVWAKVLSGVDTAINAPGHRLPNGDLLHVTVVRVESDPHPNGLNVEFVGRDQQMTRSAWWADADPVDYAHEITHMLGLRDESRHAVAPQRPDVEGSLLGDYRRPAPEGLAQGGLRGRHLQLISTLIGDLTPTPTRTPTSASARTTATATVSATATVASPPPVRRPATTSSAPGAEPYAPVLPSTRPPVLDRDLPRPLGGRRDRTGFGDGSRMPAYIDDVQELVQDAPPEVLLELVSGGMTFGHSDVVLRGTGEALAEIGRLLSTGSDGMRPEQPNKGRPAGSKLMADVTYAFTQEPKTLAGDGRVFPYTAQDGSARKLSVVARHYGDWEQFTDTYGSPVKVDGMHRSVFTAGQSKTMQSAFQIALGGPIGPVGAAAFSGFGRLGLRLGFTDRVGYGQTEQGTSQTETRALDGSRVYLDHVYYDLRVTDADGRIVTGPEPAVFGFAVRDGLSVRLPDSVMSATAAPGRIPRSMELGRQSAYRLVRTEGFGPVSRMRDWAAQEIGVAPGSTAYGELNSFFSSLSFQRQSPALSRGRVTTVPLFADDRTRTPLGVFVVDVVPGRATLITETPDAEMRDINTLAVRNDRSVQKTAAFGIDGVAGPAFNFFDLGNGALNLRLQFGAAFRYLFSVSRTAGLGGSGAIKTAGQVKGDATGLYLVRKTVYVQRSGSGSRPQQFHTWSVDRMTRTEARRLAGWDDGLRRALRAGAPEPFAPAYLTPDRPPTLGMHRVEEFAFGDGTKTGPTGATGRERTFLDTLADEVLTALAAAYPGLVARLDQLAPPEHRTWRERANAVLGPPGPSAGARPAPTTRWKNDDEYRTALANTLEVLSALSYRSMAGNLEALTTTGIRIRFNEPGRIGQGHRYIWLHGELTNRRFEGVQDDFKLRYSSVGVERVDGQKSAKRIGEAGVEGLIAFRDPLTDDIGAPNNAGGPSAGVRWGWQADEETSFGATATYEPMTVSAGPSHLYRYDLSITVDRGGYWRFRGLLRGTATLGLLGTQPFVFRQPQDLLIGTAPGGRQVGGGGRTGQVLISIPGTHAPAVDPHRRAAANPYASVALQPVRTLRPDRARALALGDLSRPGSLVRASDLVGDPGPVTPDGRGSQMFRDLQNHPFLTIGVMPSPALVSALGQAMAAGSGGAWQLTEEGAPTREAVLRAFQPQYLTANFDQSSGPLGWSASGLMGKGPYATLWATFRHLTAVDGIQALTGSVPMDTEMVLGGTGQTAGKLTKTRTFFVGGQLVYARSHAAGPGLLGTYGLVASPWSTADQSSRTVTRSFVHDMNRKGFGHQVLVSGTAEHWLALTASLLGSGAAGRPLVPDWIAAAAGRMTTVPGGWLAHVPEKSAHLVGLIDDGMGEVPRYTRHSWSPQPWLRDDHFGTYAVNALDPTAALAAFEQQVAVLGLDDAARERVRTLVSSRVLRSLDKETTGGGSSVPARTGAWGWHSVRIGKRQIRIRVQLEPGTPTFEMLDHSVEMEENRRAIETVTEGAESTKGADFGYLVGEAVHTENPTGAVAAGPTFTETGSDRKSSGESRTESTLTVFRAASTEPYAEIATPYTLRISLEADDPAPGRRGPVRTGFDRFRGKQVISVAHSAGTLREHVPLSLMAPDGEPDADLLPPPDLTGLAAPRQGVPPYVLGPDTVHGDGTLKPFRFPATGFDVRRIVGLADIQVANTYALALSYDAGFSVDGPDAARRARDTGLTRLGTGSAQALEDGTGNAALTAYYHRAVTPQGYAVPGLTEKNIVSTESAQLELYAKPDFSRARLLTVADGQKMEMLRRTGAGAASSVGRENAQDSALGAGVLISSDKTGMHQMGGSGTGPYAAEGDTLPTSADQLTSINTKPKTGRVFLFAVPTSWLSVADVRRGIKDTRVGRFVGGTFGHVRPGPKAVGSEAYALTWVRDDVARELGLIDDTNFPARVGAAWDAVGEASKAWVDADKAYWKKRRSAIGRKEERDAARIALDDAETAAGAARRRLAQSYDVAEAAHNAVEAAEERMDRIRSAGQQSIREAREALEAAEASDTGEAAHDGWAELAREEMAEARAALAAAERTSRERLSPAEVHIAALRERKAAADRRVNTAERALATADRRVGAATRRHDAAVTAFGSRRTLLGTLRTTAEDAAAEYHRVRAGTDQLTRWHQEAATVEGRKRLEGRTEPPAVTYLKPAVPAPPVPPALPAYTRTGTGPDARLTSPDEVTYALHEVPEDGNAFLHALVEGLSRSAPGLLTEQGVDLGDRRAAADAVLRMLTARLMDPSDADLLEAVAPDAMDAFSDAEVTGAGLRGSGPLAADTPGGREFDGLGGLMPHSVTPDPAARAALAVAQLMRPGNTEGEAGWNHGAADLLPVLAARTFGVDITVVDDAGRFQDFGPGPSDPTGHLAGALGLPPGGPRPHVVLSLADRHYRLALREGAVTDAKPEPKAGGKTEAGTQPEPKVQDKTEARTQPEPKPVQPSSALPPDGAARGRPVRVPVTGECLFHSFIASDPGYVRSRLPALAESDPAVYAWLGDADAVRGGLSGRAVVQSTTGHYPGGPETAVVSAMRKAVEAHVTGSGGRLPRSVIGQLRLSTTAEFGARIAGLHRAGLVSLLAHHGVDADMLIDRSEAGLRAELAVLYPTSAAPLDDAEMRTVMRAVARWEEDYITDVGEIFLPLLAHTFGARVEVAWEGRLADTRRAGPSGASRVIEVHYNGVDHYNGSSAEAHDLLVYGDSVAPKRVKPEERDGEGDVRVNPLWIPLDDVDSDLLVTANPDTVWIYAVTEDGQILLCSEQPSGIITPEQFDALLAGMRSVAPDLTADGLRKDLDGLGHTGIAARFGESGRSEPGMSRGSGEVRWSPELKRWTVNDKLSRYRSESVRPGLGLDVAAGRLREVAELLTERLGVRVVPEQVKTATAAPSGQPPAPVVPPPAAPLKGMVSVAELEAIGMTLSLAQSTQAALLRDKLPVEELGLTPEQHRLIRVQRGEPDTSAPTRLLLDSPEPSSPGAAPTPST